MGRCGRSAWLRGWAFGALAVLGAAVVMPLTVAEVSAKNSNQKYYRNPYSFGNYSREAQRKFQAEMERMRREQERAVRRNMEEMRKSSERQMRQIQSGFDRQQRREQEQAARDNERERSDGWRDRAARGGAAAGKNVGKAGGVDDTSLAKHEHQVRRLEQMRRRAVRNAEREHAAWRRQQREEVRARMREEAARRQSVDTDAPVEPGKGTSGEDQDRASNEDARRYATEQQEETYKAHKERRVKWLDGFQQQASHLGMGRAARSPGRDATSERRPEKDPAADKRPSETGAAKARKADQKDSRSRDRAPSKQKVPKFTGRELGAEMPARMFAKQRKRELIVSGLSEDGLRAVRRRGFLVGEATTLRSGRVVRRLEAPDGMSRTEAERELHRDLPFLDVTPNEAYAIYTGALGETDAASGSDVLPEIGLSGEEPQQEAAPIVEEQEEAQPAEQLQSEPGESEGQPDTTRPDVASLGSSQLAVAPASPEPCPKEICFGRQLVRWKESALGSCTRDVKVGVIDTSFDLRHPAFRRIKAKQNAFLEGAAPSPFDWHGTAVLSLLAGDPGSGTPGLLPDATFLLASAFRSDAEGNASTDTVRLLQALEWLDAHDVDIVNMSFSGPQDPAFARAIADMRRKGVVFVAAAGNMGPTAPPSYPAAYPDVIAVTAVNRKGENYRQANRGPYIDVSAPGVDILTALPDAKQGYRTGTSFAAPFVTAIAATRGRIAVADEASLSAVTAPLLKHVSTRDLGPPGRDPIFGAGLALAPPRCPTGGATIARGGGPALDSWSAQTTLIKAQTAAGAAP